MTHALKSWPEYFKAIESGTKTFDLRKDDRPYVVGDTVLMQEFDPVENGYSGDEVILSISYILRDAPKFGLKSGFCILGLTLK